MAKAPEIEFRRVSKRFGAGPLVLDGLDLKVSPGEFICVIGPSGCGKTTFLRMVAGLSRPSGGEIRFDAQADGTRPELAFIFQDATLLPWLTVLGNIELPLRLRGEPRAERRATAARLTAEVGLGAVGDYHPRQLSGGMKMRVSLARALSLSPDVLLLDEPFGALDAITRNRLNEDLLALHRREGWTAFFVTHSVTEAVFLADRILVLAAEPARVETIIPVDLPRARTLALRESDEFHDAVAEATRRMHSVLAR
ncbi:MAG: ABC transporter ATP-binding protein [Opitutales bacterium]|nr:ABC transporter ATP-binding protein [Opitutales bacterium]